MRAACEEVEGEGSIDPTDPVGTLRLRVAVRVGAFKSGSFLQDVALRRHVDVRAFPDAVFDLDRASGTSEDLALHGRIRYRDREVPVAGRGRLTFSADSASGEATFEIDVTRFGLARPKFLVLEVQDVVRVEVRLRARAR